MECKCKKPKGSIHGICQICYGKLPKRYNENPQQAKEPTTKRGKRRRHK